MFATCILWILIYHLEMPGKLITSTFIAAKGLKNRHLQTMYQALFRKVPKIIGCRERLELPNDDFLDLDWVGKGDGPIVLILHGVAGSLQSYYAAGIMKTIQERGWRGVLMYYRGTSSGPNRLHTHTHLGETEGVDFVIKTLKAREPNTPLAVVGYSMGANLLLKWQGQAGESNPLCAAVAVSAPFDLRQASNYMRFGFSRLYQWSLLRELRQHIHEKFDYRKPPMAIKSSLQYLHTIRSFWQFDDLVTAPLHGFKDAADYYFHSSSRHYLLNIVKPTLIINAKDDPFMPESVLPSVDDISDVTELEITKHGGHLGFVAGTMRKPEYWLEQRIPEFLEKYLEA